MVTEVVPRLLTLEPLSSEGLTDAVLITPEVRAINRAMLSRSLEAIAGSRVLVARVVRQLSK